MNREELKKIIQEEVIIKNNFTDSEPILMPNGTNVTWFFDFRLLLFNKEFLTTVSQMLLEKISSSGQVQFAGLESASLPLITALILQSENTTGFYIRKSRKKKMQMRQIEGKVSKQKDTILVDDAMNTGNSFRKQIEILEKEDICVSKVCSIVRFRNVDEYEYFKKKNIDIISLFDLSEFELTPTSTFPKENFKLKWYFGAKNPHLLKLQSKIQPIIDDNFIYYASDNGYAWCINKNDGKVVWQVRLLWRVHPSISTFTNLDTNNKDICIGSYNGKIFILQKQDGKIKSVLQAGDQISAGPMYLGTDSILCITRHAHSQVLSSILSLNSDTLELTWEHQHNHRITALPLYNKESDLIHLVDCEGNLLIFENHTGKLKKKRKKVVKGLVRQGIFNLDMTEIAFGSSDDSVYILDCKSGALKRKIYIGGFLYATPCIVNKKIYCASNDQLIYCHNYQTGQKIWEFETKGRIFSSPVVKDGFLYVGNNEGKLYKLNAENGQEESFFYVTERITNPVTIENGTIYISTFANEIYAISSVDSKYQDT